MKYVGSRVLRHEDPRLLTGRGFFVDDETRPGQLWMRVVRSTSAHALIRSIDLTEAQESDGVLAVICGRDVELPVIPVRVSPLKDEMAPYLQPVLATERVRYVGEPVAVIVATDPYLAEDAAERVIVEYDELPVLLDAEQSAASDVQMVPGHSNEVAVLRASFGDVDASFASAEHVVEIDVTIGRQTAVPIETRGLVAEWSPDDERLDIWGATKVPHYNRRVIAAAIGLTEYQVNIHRTDAGGGFGVRGELYPEDFLVPYLALRLGRPIKWVEDRAEHLVSTNHSRDQRHLISGAFDRSGHLLGLRDEVWHGNGGYVRTHGLTVPELTITMLPGPYRLPAYEGVCHIVLTNKTPCGTYRAPGRYEGTFARERLLDIAAVQLGIDPLEIRRVNLLSAEELPMDRGLIALGTSVVLDDADYQSLLEVALVEADYSSWQNEATQLRAQGQLVGTGMAVFLEKSGLGPYETAAVEIDREGGIQVSIGGTSLGQGIETIMAQIAADELTVNIASVDVVGGETASMDDGMGSWASRSTVVGGSAVLMAARATSDLALQVAATLLEVSPEELTLRDGRVEVNGSSERAMSLGDVAAVIGNPPAGVDLGCKVLGARRKFSVEHMTYPYGVHFAQVRVDGDTGAVSVLRYFVAYEVGRAMNPMTVEGQLIGGAIQGIGGALLEELVYGPDGQPLSATLIDYLLPTAGDAPTVGTLITESHPSSSNPLGAKGAGEGGLTACGATIASAVGNAIGKVEAPTRLPLSPMRVRAMVASAAASTDHVSSAE